jgi:hypothetical protein
MVYAAWGATGIYTSGTGVSQHSAVIYMAGIGPWIASIVTSARVGIAIICDIASIESVANITLLARVNITKILVRASVDSSANIARGSITAAIRTITYIGIAVVALCHPIAHIDCTTIIIAGALIVIGCALI